MKIIKKISLIILINVLFTPVFALENQDTEVNKPEDEKPAVVNNAPKKRLKPAQVRPKREQKKTIRSANKSLTKFKAQFQKRKETELRLLRDEYEILEYSP